MTMGEKILKLRKARGWNQEDLAEQIGVSRQAVSRWESDSAKPDADKIVAICDLFGISTDYLLRDVTREADSGDVEKEIRNPLRTLSPRRWLGGILIVVCSAVMVVIWVMSLIYPVTLDRTVLLREFLWYHKLFGVWFITWIGLAVGLWKSFSPVPLKETRLYRQFLEWKETRCSNDNG